MKSIERRFNNIQEKKQGWSTYLCFAEAVKGQKFSREALHRWFNKLVDKDDYAASDKKNILTNLESLTNDVTTPKNDTKSSP